MPRFRPIYAKGRVYPGRAYTGTGRKTTMRKLKKLHNRSKVVRNLPMVNMGWGFPKKLLMRHRYSDTIQLATGALGVLNTYNWRCNGMFDPNQTGVGHQPYYFDQLTALYDHYVVIGSKMRIRFTPTAANTNPCYIGVLINDDTSITGALSSLLESPLAKHRLTAFNENQTHTFTIKWSAKKFFGGSILANTELQGTSAADPTEQSLFTAFIESSTSGSASTYQIEVLIDYIAVWKELKDISPS